MAFDCLINLVGISKGVGVPPVEEGEETGTPESGLYITSLPDITLLEIGKIADTDQVDVAGVWADVQSRGILKFRTLFISEMNKCWKVSKQSLAECIICENSLLLATSLWYLLGAELMWERINSNRLNRYTSIDKAKAKTLRDDLMELFHTELAVAVAGIDIFSSECFETDCLEPNGIVTFMETQP